MKNLNFKRLLIVSIIILFGTNNFAQSKKFIGIDVLQFQTGTMNLNFSKEITPYFSLASEVGYTFNYVKFGNLDWLGFWLSPHQKCVPEYEFEKISGGYLKLGGYFNSRKNFEKNNFPHLGVFLTNSVVHELANKIYDENGHEMDPILKEHYVNLIFPVVSVGYQFKMGKRLNSNIDFQASFPPNNIKDLFGFYNFIPGIGQQGSEYQEVFFMLIWNLKYQLCYN